MHRVRFSKRSMYDMGELRSVAQKACRNVLLFRNELDEALLGADREESEVWRRFHYFVAEYLETMRRDPSILALFVSEDCASANPDVLERVATLLGRPGC